MLASTAGTRVVGLGSDDSVCIHIEEAAPAPGSPSWSTRSCARLTDPLIGARPITSTTYIGRDRWLFMALVPNGIGTVELSTDQGQEVFTVANSKDGQLDGQERSAASPVAA